MAAQADEVDLTPGPTVVADPNSPTGYTGHFVYYNPTATSVRFVADILLRNWADPTDTTVYQPSQYRPGLMRGGGGYDVEMTNAGDGYWVTDVPLAAGANQYWFYVNNNTNLWVADPANSPIYAPDGLTGTARRAFNKVYVPYDAAKQNYAPLAARVIENCREPTRRRARGATSRSQIARTDHADASASTCRPDYDANRAEPYKTIYMQHGGGQDQSDWMNMGDVPVIMDNLIQDGPPSPRSSSRRTRNYLGSAAAGVSQPAQRRHPVRREQLQRLDAPRSTGHSRVCRRVLPSLRTSSTSTPRSSGTTAPGAEAPRCPPPRRTSTSPTSCSAAGDGTSVCPTRTQVAALDQVAFVENVVVAGAHDFNTWNQMFTTFARDYLWHPEAFIIDKITDLKDGVAATSLNKGNKNALTVKLDQAYKLLAKGENDGVLEVLNGFVAQVERADRAPAS